MIKLLSQKSNLIPLFIFALFLISPSSKAFSQRASEKQEPEMAELIQEGIEATIRENYGLAERNFNEIISREPENPAGYFFLAGSFQTQMIDFESDFREKEFYQNLEKSIELSKKRLEKDKKDLWAYFYLGNSYGSMAVYDANHKRWWSGLRKGLKAKSALKKVVELDSAFYDAYLGLGSYHYWASVVTKALRWLPFFRDERKTGMEEVKLAAEKSVYSRESAEYGLIYMYLEEKEYEKVIGLAKEMNQKFPESKLFLWPLAEAVYLKRDWMGAIGWYHRILELIGNPDPSGYFNAIECRERIAECYFNLEMFEKCKDECEKILEYPLSKEVQKKQKKKLKKTENRLKECHNL
jgi:outer membrane protein assembly factor BamD (BamD/ComL family)